MIMNNLISKLLSLIYLNVYADDFVGQNFCQDFGSTIKIMSIAFLIIRICIPLFIIVMGTMDIYKTVTTGKTDELNKGLKTLGKRFIIGFIILFLPNVVNMVVSSLNGDTADYKICVSCMANPSACPENKK